MLNTLARFLQMDLEVRCKGDLYVDDHHTVEDVALALGTAFDKALGQRTGIKRYLNSKLFLPFSIDLAVLMHL